MTDMTDSAVPAMPVLEGPRVRLRPLRADDADALFAVHSDARVMRYWSHAPWTERAQAAARLAQLENDRRDSEFYQWAITVDGDDELVGTVSVFALNRAQFRADVGYALAASVWGRGYATEALKLAVDFAFGTLGLRRLEADIDPRNEASCRLVERLGFRREGLLRERWYVAGEATDSAMYGLLAREHAAAR
jgi:[ribosomal protein S5]-alanine N-acetyltransferase